MADPVKWAVVGQPPFEEHYQALHSFLKQEGLENEVSFHNVVPANFSDEFSKLMKNVQSIRVDHPHSRRVVELFEHFPVDTLFLKYADHAEFKGKRWWLRSLLTESVKRLIVNSHMLYDYSGMALVAGAGASARAIIMGLTQLGLKSIAIVNPVENDAKELIEEFKKHCFNMDFVYLSPDEIRTEPAQYTLLINTTPHKDDNEILPDLCYFNFLLPGGLVIDLNIGSAQSLLLQEAQKMNSPIFTGSDLLIFKDLFWIEQVFGKTIEAKKYSQFISEKK